VLLVWTERRGAAPMLPLWLFRNRDFAGANALTVLLYSALTAALFLLPFMLIEVHRYSAAAAGAAFLPLSAIMGVGSRPSGALVEKLGSRILLTVGPAVAAAGYALLAVSAENPSYWSGILPGLLLVGVGMTISVAPLTTTVFDAAPANRSRIASGINNAAARSGGLVAVAAVGLAFNGAALSSVEPATLINAYRSVMFAAALLSLLSATVGGFTIGPRSDRK